jgi:F-type H+-transporting ATPase subunit beta
MSQTMNSMRPSIASSESLEIRFYVALRRGDLSRVSELLRQHPELLETPQEWGNELVTRGILPFANKASPLITAIELNDLPMMTLLLDAGADVNGTCGCATGESPLWAAVLTNRHTHTRVLLERGADPNQRSAAGNLPLHLAAMRGFLEITRLLLDHGADQSIKDDGGRFPQPWSTADGKPEQSGRTALEWAIAMGETNIVELLSRGPEQPLPSANNDISLTPTVLLTGLKALDLFAPLPRGGIVRIPFKAGVGLMVLMGELCHRFVHEPSRSMIWTGFTAPPYDLADWQADMAEFNLTSQIHCGLASYQASPAARRHCFEATIRQAEQLRDDGADVLVVVQSAVGFESDVDASLLRLKTPSLAGSITTLVITPFPEVPDSNWRSIEAPFDGQILLDRNRAQKHLYPAINPEFSNSRVLTAGSIEAQHATLSGLARQALVRYAETDPHFEMQSDDGQDAEIAVRLLRYLCQPFHVTAPFTGRLGETVSIAQLLDEVDQILTAKG